MKPVTLTEQGIKALGAKLEAYRKSQCWGVREASRYICSKIEPGLTPTALSRIEAGSVTLKTDTMLMLSQIGYGGMSFTEMVDIATDRRLAVCEKGGTYKVSRNQEVIAV